MPLIYCGDCSHAPGITARAERADTQTRQALHKALFKMGKTSAPPGPTRWLSSRPSISPISS